MTTAPVRGGNGGPVSFRLADVKVDQAKGEFRKHLDRALDRIGLHWQGEARKLTPVQTGRLRSSIAWSSPNQQQPVTIQGDQNTARLTSGGVETTSETFTPPKPPDNTVIVGSNVAYAAAVHEGFDTTDEPYEVKEHWRTITQAFGKPIPPKRVRVKAHMSRTGIRHRAPSKFLEDAGNANAARYREMIQTALEGRDAGPVIPRPPSSE